MYCECGKRSENVRTGGPCASCRHAARKADRKAGQQKKVHRIAKVSKKTASDRARYNRESREWLVGKRCAVDPNRPATEVHHKMGRQGYADAWARENGIKLIHDRRFWLPVSHEGHEKITKNSAWAFEMGFTLLRTAKI